MSNQAVLVDLADPDPAEGHRGAVDLVEHLAFVAAALRGAFAGELQVSSVEERLAFAAVVRQASSVAEERLAFVAGVHLAFAAVVRLASSVAAEHLAFVVGVHLAFAVGERLAFAVAAHLAFVAVAGEHRV